MPRYPGESPGVPEHAVGLSKRCVTDGHDGDGPNDDGDGRHESMLGFGGEICLRKELWVGWELEFSWTYFRVNLGTDLTGLYACSSS